MSTDAKPTARRDHLIDIEKAVRQQWADAKLYEQNAPTGPDALKNKKKFMVTFPYPYMNGALHLGHAFSLSKAEFIVRYQRLLGKTTLFPFGFHCTGMPILACAQKLQKEIAMYGNPPKFPEVATEPEEDDDHEGDAEPEAETTTDDNAAAATAAAAPKKRKKKGKLAAKTGKETYQWNIMKEMNVPESEISKFQDPGYWLKYWPPIAKTDLDEFGLAVDWRRSFITTDVNPYYDAFIKWQFNHLRKKGKVNYGKLMSICTPSNMQVCADHDRKEGEGVMPQAYTLIKLQLQQPYPESVTKILSSNNAQDVKVYLPAATLRPETMYGQTNAFVLPTGTYSMYRISKDEVYITTDRAAANMAAQEMFAPLEDATMQRKMGEVIGQDLLGCAITAPLAKYDKVYILPLLSILMDKGTGIVTSVPSDAPADYAALMDMKNKPDFRAKYGITDEMVMPYEVVPIIYIEELEQTNEAAVLLCKKYGVKSQNDTVLLNKIKDEVYKYGFDKGILTVGEYKGKFVKDVKDDIKNWMISQGMAVAYSEPEQRVVSRTDEECVAALVNQWFITYGEEQWQSELKEHVTSESFNPYNKPILNRVLFTIGWLRQWGCSRAFGLGTKLPFDDQFLVESLSDSTIYMAYYTIANLLQGGVLDGSVTGSANIKPEQLTDALFDYVFLDAPYTEDIGVPEEVLKTMRHEFEYWYPMDLRVSGKDLLNNHLIMALYNHNAIWDNRKDRMPQGYYANGLLMIDNQKMSKSTGNFLTLHQAMSKFGVDATRLALACAGDSLDDANFSSSVTDGAILRLTREEEYYEDMFVRAQTENGYRTGELQFWDKVVLNQLYTAVKQTAEAYDNIVIMDAVKYGFYELLNIRDEYRLACGDVPLHKDVLHYWANAFIIVNSPIIPYWTQYMYAKLLQHGWTNNPNNSPFVYNALWPEVPEINNNVLKQGTYVNTLGALMRSNALRTSTVMAKKNKGVVPVLRKVTIKVATVYPKWQQDIITKLSEIAQAYEPVEGQAHALASKDIMGKIKVMFAGNNDKKLLTAAMSFTVSVINDYAANGNDALQLQMPFDEIATIKDNLAYIIRTLDPITVDDVTVEEYIAPEGAVGVGANIPLPGKPVLIFTE